MRMFLLFILLFIPITSLANTSLTTCSEYNQYPDSCNSTAGCQHKDGVCVQCDEDSYCPATETEPKPCPTNFSKSALGATDKTECFAEIQTNNKKCYWIDNNENPYNRCGRFYPNGDPKCWNDGDSSYDTGFHNEGDKCYYNNRSCEAFTSSGCNDAPEHQILGEAFWETDHWELSACQCLQGNTMHANAHCIATIQKTPTTTTQTSATATVSYNNISWYYCTGCPAGSYVNPDTDFQTNSTCYTGPGSSSLIVCQCTESEQGFYSSGFTISYPIDNGSTSTYANPPYLEKCEFGKTTSDPGAPSADDCEYTDQTKFCDAKGCFQFGNDFENWDLHI